MSVSAGGSVKDPTEERFPLLLQLLEEEHPPDTETDAESKRGNRIHNGVAMLLGRWPGYITAGCISAAFLSILTFLTVIMIMTILIVSSLDSHLAHDLVTNRETALLEIETSCDYIEEEEKIQHKSRKQSNFNIFNFMTYKNASSSTAKKDNISLVDLPLSASHKVFLVVADDFLSQRHLCAIESAARVMTNFTCYLIMLSENITKINTTFEARLTEILDAYPNLKLFRIKPHKYFFDSPIRNVLHKINFTPSVLVFAARILTLWRYGGITYDLDLITLNNVSSASYPIPHNDNVMVSREGGSVMSVRLQCHAFLYELMTSLTSMFKDQHQNCNISNNEVIQHALKSFCYNVGMEPKPVNQLAELPYKVCKGVTAMPQYMICRKTSERISTKNHCVWASCSGSSLKFREHHCPLSYHTHVNKEKRKLTTHKPRHRHSG